RPGRMPTICPSRRLTLYILRPACQSAALMTVPFSRHGFLQAELVLNFPLCWKPCLEKGTVISAADLQAGLKMYNVTLREGDIVVIHTGWGDLFEQFPAQNAAYNSGEPGIGKDAAKWLIGQKVVAVGADTWAVE